MTEQQEWFLKRLMDRYAIEYPARYRVGVEKYKSTIHEDYTVDEHLRNLREELYDALAYLEAIQIIYEQEQHERDS